MAQNVLTRAAAFSASRQLSRRERLYALVAVAVVVLMALTGWWITSTHVIDLNGATPDVRSHLLNEWAKGDVVVLIRHAERCDKSTAACLGPADGITFNGSQAASAVGIGLNQLGMENARVLVSPLTRTRQTAAAIAGRGIETQTWLQECDSAFASKVMRAKVKGENLVLVTHSGCIDHLERRFGVVAGGRSSDYAQAFFVQVDGRRDPEILGALAADQWKRLTTEQWN